MYEVLAEAPPLQGQERVRIKLIETGEEAEYSAAEMLRDSIAA